MFSVEPRFGTLRPIGARSIHTRVIGRATAQIIKPVVAEHLGTLNAVVDTVGCEKIIKVTTALLEKFPNHVVLLPDIINAFNTMARAKMLKNFIEKFPVAGRYLKLTYGNDPRLIQGFNKMDLFNETGAAQGCNLGSMLFAVAYNEVLEEVREFAETQDAEGMKTLIAAFADDTTLVGELKTVVHLFLLIQKIAKQKYNLDFTELNVWLTLRQGRQKGCAKKSRCRMR